MVVQSDLTRAEQIVDSTILGHSSRPRPLEHNVDQYTLRLASKPRPLVSAAESVTTTQGSQMD